MPSTFFGVDIAASGMKTYQAAMNTTSHNISNIATEGYSKQYTVRSASTPISVSSTYGMVGTGVNADSIEQNRSLYYDKKYRYNNGIYNNYVSKEYYMSCIENNLYTSDTKVGSVSTSLDNLFNSLTNLTSDASDKTIRTESVTYANNMASYVKDLATSFQNLQKEANFEIKTSVEQINALSEKIASLNKQINSLEVTGGMANDLRDARNVLVDELSSYANITVTETAKAEGIGNPQYLIQMGNATLVDSYEYQKINIVPMETHTNQNDADSLYDLVWEGGQKFPIRSTALGGKLQALFEVRDGNNSTAFHAQMKDAQTDANDVTTVTLDKSNINDMFLLNLPEGNGVLTIGANDYAYNDFSVTVAADGSYEYTFTLKDKQSDAQKALLTQAVTQNRSVEVGEDVAYKGIPYYMAQLNQFIRTFASGFNKVHNEGFDLNGEAGKDLFTANNMTDGMQMNFAEKGEDGSYYLDGVRQTSYQFTSALSGATNGTYTASYYSMNALNFSVNQSIVSDVTKLACSSNAEKGVGENLNLKQLVLVKSDASMFIQGTPASFLQTMVSSAGVDAKKATNFMKSQKNVVDAIDNRRMSISGVDEDEEAADLVKFQNLLYFQYKVLSTMDEVFDKLINGTAV